MVQHVDSVRILKELTPLKTMTSLHEAPPPQKIVHYPIHGDLNGGTLILLGDKHAKQVVFMMGGFPDDHQVCEHFNCAQCTSERIAFSAKQLGLLDN